MSTQPIRIENLRAVQRELRELGDKDLKRKLRAANKEAASVVAEGAEGLAPERSGRLKGSIGVQAGQRDAAVKAGTASRVPYAGVIHYGWPRRGIRPQPFIIISLSRRKERVREVYAESLDEVVQALNNRIGS